MKKTFFLSAAICSLTLFSCDKNNQADTGVEKSALGPVDTVQNWSKDVSDGRIASLWDALPSSYQKDISDIITEFANNTDEEIYNESQKLTKSLTALLKSKKDIALAIANKQIPDDNIKGKVKENYDTTIDLLNAIANSDTQTLSGLKSLDIAKFCGDIQPHIKNVMVLATDSTPELKAISSMTPKLISEDGDTAEVEVTIDGKTENINIVKVDNRWVPEDLQKDWEKNIAKAKAEIQKSSQSIGTNKEEVITLLKTVQEAIADLETAKNEDEMMGKLMGASQKIGPLLMPLIMGGAK